jgi:hypothetical protein
LVETRSLGELTYLDWELVRIVLDIGIIVADVEEAGVFGIANRILHLRALYMISALNIGRRVLATHFANALQNLKYNLTP